MNLSNVVGDFYVSETTVFSNGTVGANLSAGGEGTKRLNGTLKNDVDFRGVNLGGVDFSAFDLSGHCSTRPRCFHLRDRE